MAWIRFQTGSAVFNTSVSLRYNSPLACKILMTTRKAALKTYFLTGLLILVPLAITLWVISLIIGAMDQTLTLLPEAWQPERLLGFHLPGLGTLLTIAFIFTVGLLAQNYIGQTLVQWWETLLRYIPVFGPLYTSIKQVSDTLFSDNGHAFRKALLIEYPRRGAYTIAFLTGAPGGDVINHLNGDYVSVDVPTTPSPTSGCFLMLPRVDVIELYMTVDAALKYIVSMGVVTPATPLNRSEPVHDLTARPRACVGRRSESNEHSILWSGEPDGFRQNRIFMRLGCAPAWPRWCHFYRFA